MPLTRGRLVPLTAGLAAISTDSLYGGCLGLPLAARSPGELPQNVFRYILEASWLHQLLLLVLTAAIFLLEVVPLELQRRVVNNLVKHRDYQLVIILCAVYAGIIFVQGGAKLALNVYRGWVGERAKRDLRRRILSVIEAPPNMSPAAEAQGIAVSMIVAEVEPIGGFVGESISEPLLQGGILLSVLAYIIHLDPWMALAASAIFLPQFLFVPLLQRAINRRTGARVRVLRQLGIGVIAQNGGPDARACAEDMRINRAFALDMGIYRLKFSMNFLMNLCNHFQIIAALLLGGWWVCTGRLEIGGVVAFISGIGRLNDPWGDLVNYFRDVSVTQVKFRLVAMRSISSRRDYPIPPRARSSLLRKIEPSWRRPNFGLTRLSAALGLDEAAPPPLDWAILERAAQHISAFEPQPWRALRYVAQFGGPWPKRSDACCHCQVSIPCQQDMMVRHANLMTDVARWAGSQRGQSGVPEHSWSSSGRAAAD